MMKNITKAVTLFAGTPAAAERMKMSLPRSLVWLLRSLFFCFVSSGKIPALRSGLYQANTTADATYVGEGDVERILARKVSDLTEIDSDIRLV